MTRMPAMTFMVVLGRWLPAAAAAQTIMPNAGQSAKQMTANEAACASQATAQSGCNPAAASATAAPSRGERARGAAPGAVREQRTDADEREVEDPNESAARLGAAAGGVRQRRDRRETRRERQRATQGQAACHDIFRSCMTGHGYTVQ